MRLFLFFPGLPGVLWVLPDSYLDVPNKDYGGLITILIPLQQTAYIHCFSSTENRTKPNRIQPSCKHNTKIIDPHTLTVFDHSLRHFFEQLQDIYSSSTGPYSISL